MGFFFVEESTTKKTNKNLPVHTARRLQCAVCPLFKAKIVSPKMPGIGHDQPLVYFIVSNPTNEEDVAGQYYKGKARSLLKTAMGLELYNESRTHSIIRCHNSSKDPSNLNFIKECCKDFLTKDILASKPEIIVPVGEEALHWLLGENSVYKWRGRLISIDFNGHTCYAYPILDPSVVIGKRRRFEDKRTHEIKERETEWDDLFFMDLENLNKLIYELEPAYVAEPSEYMRGLQYTEGNKSDAELAKVLDWLGRLCDEPVVGIDIETSCLRPYHSYSLIATIAIGTFDKTYAFPYAYPGAWTASQLKVLKAALIDFFPNSGIKVAHNLKFEQEWFAVEFGDEVIRNSKWDDTYSQAYSLDERRGMHNLEVLIQIHFGFKLKELSKIDRSRILEYPLSKVLPYNGLDTKWTFALYNKQQNILNKKENKRLKKVNEYLVRTSPTLVLAQKEGICVNKNLLEKMAEEAATEITTITKRIKGLSEVEEYEKRFGAYNPGSPDNLLTLLTKIVGYTDELNNKAGKWSTEEPVLASLHDCNVAKETLKLRAISKKASTYITPIKPYLDNKDGRIHTNYNPYFTTTGRLSSDNPNMQNWPNRKGREIRRVVVPPKGWLIVSADYGQIEARLLGLASQDKAFCDALWNDYDIHMEWAEKIANAYPAVIGGEHNLQDKNALKKFRKDVKNQWTFPAFYGASPYSIAKYLGIPIDACLDLFKEFWKTFSGVKAWQKWITDFYNKHGYVETLTGRRRRAPLSFNERLNSPIQGTASDICVNAMNALSELNNPDIRVIMNVHDDVTSYVREETLEDSIEQIAEIMCTAPNQILPNINVPIAAEISVGYNWCDLEDAGVYKSTDYIHVPKKLGRPEDFIY